MFRSAREPICSGRHTAKAFRYWHQEKLVQLFGYAHVSKDLRMMVLAAGGWKAVRAVKVRRLMRSLW